VRRGRGEAGQRGHAEEGPQTHPSPIGRTGRLD
jgi:hypothetical protein